PGSYGIPARLEEQVGYLYWPVPGHWRFLAWASVPLRGQARHCRTDSITQFQGRRHRAGIFRLTGPVTMWPDTTLLDFMDTAPAKRLRTSPHWIGLSWGTR